MLNDSVAAVFEKRGDNTLNSEPKKGARCDKAMGLHREIIGKVFVPMGSNSVVYELEV